MNADVSLQRFCWPAEDRVRARTPPDGSSYIPSLHGQRSFTWLSWQGCVHAGPPWLADDGRAGRWICARGVAIQL